MAPRYRSRRAVRTPESGVRTGGAGARVWGSRLHLRAPREPFAGSREADGQTQRRGWPRIDDGAAVSEAGIDAGPDFGPADDDSRFDATGGATSVHDSGSTSCANSITSVPSGLVQTTIGSTLTTVSGVRSGSSMA